MKTLITFFLVLAASASLHAQESSETFYQIRLEDQATGHGVMLRPATAMSSSYTLTWPASIPVFGSPTEIKALTVNSSTNFSWSNMAQLNGSAGQVGYFTSASEMTGSPSLTWDNTNARLTLTSAIAGPALSLTKSGVQTALSTGLSVENLSTATTTGANKVALNVVSTGAILDTNRGMTVSVAGGGVNYAATFSGGNVGIGTSAPNTSLDVNGTWAVRELNFTGSLSSGATFNNNVDFGSTNAASYVRIGTSMSASWSLTGLVGGTDGKRIDIYNATGHVLTIKNENAGSSAANRIRTSNGGDIVVNNGAMVGLIYSANESRWRIFSLSPLNVQTLAGLSNVTTVAANTVLPVSTSSYVKITNTTANYQVLLEDGIVIGQICVVHNVEASTKDISFKTSSPTNIAGVAASLNSVGPGMAYFFVWDGTYWQLISRKS